MQFVNTTKQSGITYYGGLSSYGASWVDFNNDGLMDLIDTPHWRKAGIQEIRLYINEGNGKFTDMAPFLFNDYHSMSTDTHGMTVADYDNDGDKDIAFNVGGAPYTAIITETVSTFYVNENGRLIEKARYLGVDGVLGKQNYELGKPAKDSHGHRGRGIAWVDANGDGLLDLIHSNWQFTERHKSKSPLIRKLADQGLDQMSLYIQKPNHRFERLLNFTGKARYSTQVFPADLLADQVLDLVMAEDYRDKLTAYTAKGQGRFVKIKNTLPSGIEEDAGIVIADVDIHDFDNNGTPEILVIPVSEGFTEPGLPIYLHYDKTTKTYVDKAQEAGFTKAFNASDSTVADFNNDGYLDIYITTSKYINNAKRVSEVGILYQNTGKNGKFVQVKNNAGILPKRTSNTPVDRHGILTGGNQRTFTADYDLNGFQDVFVTNLTENDGDNQFVGSIEQVTPSYLFANKGNSNKWLEIDLQGTKSNRDALGAQVKLTTPDGMTQYRDLYPVLNQGFGQNSSRLHFGLNNHKLAKKIQIIWPSGLKQVLTNVSANQIIQVKESNDSSPSYQSIKVGNSKNDKFTGTGLDNTIIGQGGNDVISGLEGHDKLSGGDDKDTLNGGNGNDALFGNDYNDLLRGEDDNDTLNGGNHNDILEGGKGTDSLIGGLGADLLTGGPGADSFVFYSPNDAKDTITDFTVSKDKIVVSQRVFSDTRLRVDIIPRGTLPAENFVLGTGNTNARSGTFVYDNTTGNLYYESYADAFYASPGDPGGKIHLATFTSKPALSYRNIILE